MSLIDSPNKIEAGALGSFATVGDYFALLKPRVMSLVIFTGFAGLIVAPGEIEVLTMLTALLCIAVGAGAAGALNMACEYDIDSLMRRTKGRPIPRGIVLPGEALAFGTTLAVGAITVMGLLINYVAAALLAFTIAFYVFVYTLWLKRRTPQNIVIGGLAGALPPAIGWAAVTGSLSLPPLVLVAIIFLWTPPHFWALSLFRDDDYRRAGIPMLPVVMGKDWTRLQIALYSAVLAISALAPVALGFAGPLYLLASATLGPWFFWQSLRVVGERDTESEPEARRLFAVSILYLFVLFASLIAERLMSVAPLLSQAAG